MFFDVFVKFFVILDLAGFILIFLQAKPNVEEFKALFTASIVVFSVTSFFSIFPILIQGICLWAYFEFGQQLTLKLLSSGPIDYSFVWSLPEGINNLISVSVGGKFVDFLFWSGFILAALFSIDRLERRSLVFLAKNMKIGWASELLIERLEELSKAQKKEKEIIEGRKEEIKDQEMPLPPVTKEIKERIIFKPRFFKDRLWYMPLFFLSTTLPLLALPFIVGGASSFSDIITGGLSNPFFFVFGGTFLVTFLIFLIAFLWEAFTRIILEKDKIIIKNFFFVKKEFLYQNIKNIAVEGNDRGMETLIIGYEKQAKGRQMLKMARLFLWPFTTEKILEELKLRADNIAIDDNLIRKIRATRNVGNIIGVIITIVLCVGLIYFIFYQVKNRPIFSDTDCANQLGFWINDESTTKILETKEGFRPELSIKSPFYFFIDAEKSAPECNKKISLVIYDAKGNIVFQRENLTSPKTGIVNYYWENFFKAKGDYIFKVNYGNILAKKINFSVK